MIFKKMNRNGFLQLFSIVLAMHTMKDGLIVNASSASHKARPKIDLSDPFYNGQIHYDDTLTETPIGTIVYAIDDESVEVDPFTNDKTKTIQLQDVVTHGIPNDKSFMNHNLFTIGDDNDAIVENDSDEDDDVIDIDGIVEKHATDHSKFANFAFNNEKIVPKIMVDNSKAVNSPAQIQLQPKQQQQQQQPQTQQQQLSNATDQNIERDSQQGHQQTANTIIGGHSTNRQMTYKHSNKTSTARTNMKSHRHRNHKAQHNVKWYRRHHKWLKQHKAKAHRNRHRSASRSGLKPQRINSGIKSNARAPPAYVQAHVSFYDSSYDDTLNSNRFTSDNNYRNDDKWPHLKKLQSQLHQDILSDSLPPYIKKYSRRNKQLIGLLEGEGMPNLNDGDSNSKQTLNTRRRPKQTTKWIEKNLFEEQLNERQNKTTESNPPPPPPPTIDTKSIASMILNSKQRYLTEKNVQSEPNALPGEHLSLSSEEYDECDDGTDCNGLRVIHRTHSEHIKKKANLSPKADSFLFHRVATPKLVGTAAIAGGLIKQKLPFVALTDKRIEDGTRQRRINTVQNTFPLP